VIPTILKTIALVIRLTSYAPHVDAPHAFAHVIAAELAASPGLPAELLLAMAYVESRYDATATSYVADGRRVGGRWPSRSQAGEGPRFCGVMQTAAGHDWEACLAQRPLLVGYRRGAGEIAKWLPHADHDLQQALNGYGCGFAGMRNGCRNYGARVLAVARRFGFTDRRAGI
jgi:hypothetical protein